FPNLKTAPGFRLQQEASRCRAEPRCLLKRHANKCKLQDERHWRESPVAPRLGKYHSRGEAECLARELPTPASTVAQRRGSHLFPIIGPREPRRVPHRRGWHPPLQNR